MGKSVMNPLTIRCLTRTPDAARDQELRALRTELMLRRESPTRADVVAIVSAGRDEGRSMLAADLAVAFAEAGHATLLVDADLRNPRQHHLFGLPEGHGLMQLLRDGTPPVLHSPDSLADLDVITAGGVPARPLDLLSHPGFADEVDGWRDGYRFVVLDTPPLVHWPDAAVIANATGRVLLATRGGQTRYHELRLALRRLAPTRSRVMGAVINHF